MEEMFVNFNKKFKTTIWLFYVGALFLVSLMVMTTYLKSDLLAKITGVYGFSFLTGVATFLVYYLSKRYHLLKRMRTSYSEKQVNYFNMFCDLFMNNEVEKAEELLIENIKDRDLKNVGSGMLIGFDFCTNKENVHSG